MNKYKRINASEAKKLVVDVDNVLFCDVRSEADYSESHDSRAINLTQGYLPLFISEMPKNKPVVVICYHGNSSQSVAQYLTVHGFEDVYSVDGGYEAWQNEE
ncbi:MAG: rhodanese-like domain-containing protein [Dysgonomonas sp.]